MAGSRTHDRPRQLRRCPSTPDHTTSAGKDRTQAFQTVMCYVALAWKCDQGGRCGKDGSLDPDGSAMPICRDDPVEHP
jgi:hypothetical protein